jgi:DNA repair protein RadD
MAFEKRAYETRAARDIPELLAQHGRVLAVGPTGCGKTVIAAMIIKRWSGRVLFLAHKYELIDQAYRRLADAGVAAGVVMAHDESLNGDERVNHSARVQIASVQTASSRGLTGDFDLIVFDEAHRAVASSYQNVAKKYPRARVLGLTATPCRQDGLGLGAFFNHLYEIAKPSELYASGFLAKPRTFAAPPETVQRLVQELKKVASYNGDYNQQRLAAVVDNQLLVGNIVSESIRLAPGVPKVVFAAGVEHSKKIAARFRRRGIASAHLDGGTPPDERAEIIERLRRRDVEVVCNVDVLSEGWDLPALGAVIIARPTKSLARFLQMCGRVQRKYGNRIPLILDHGNNVLRHQVLPTDDVNWSLDEDTKQGNKGQAIYKTCHACFTFMRSSADSCPSCGAEREIDQRDRELQEREARLEEVLATKRAAIRSRVETLALAKSAPSGWVDRVLAELAA